MPLDHAVVLREGKDNEEVLNLLWGADFTKRILSSQAFEAFNRHNGWKLGTFGVWILRRALK